MDKIGRLLSIVDNSLNSKKRRHITGGAFMSIALLFGGLAVTIFTVKIDPEEENKKIKNAYKNPSVSYEEEFLNEI